MVRNSAKFVPWKDCKPVTCDLKRIGQSVNKEEELLALKQFAVRKDINYPQIRRTWRMY